MKYHYYVSYSVSKIHLTGNIEICTDKKISSFEDTTLMKEFLAEQMNSGAGKFSMIKTFNTNISADDIIFYSFPQLIRDEPY